MIKSGLAACYFRTPQNGYSVEFAAEEGGAERGAGSWRALGATPRRRCIAVVWGITRLADKYSSGRVEAAAERALLTGACRYRSVESILKNSLDRQPLPAPPSASSGTSPRHANIRGSEYFE
jgi:hypothetical protein